jgi:hypothetical protein
MRGSLTNKLLSAFGSDTRLSVMILNGVIVSRFLIEFNSYRYSGVYAYYFDLIFNLFAESHYELLREYTLYSEFGISFLNCDEESLGLSLQSVLRATKLLSSTFYFSGDSYWSSKTIDSS